MPIIKDARKQTNKFLSLIICRSSQVLTLPLGLGSTVFVEYLHLPAPKSGGESPLAPPHLGQSLLGSSIHLPLNQKWQESESVHLSATDIDINHLAGNQAMVSPRTLKRSSSRAITIQEQNSEQYYYGFYCSITLLYTCKHSHMTW